MIHEFRLPDIGEGLHEAELMEWSVKVGDVVEEGQDLVSVSTDKANVELPSPRAGTVVELCGEPGDMITVGDVIVRLECGGTFVISAESEANEALEQGQPSNADLTFQASESAKVKASPAVRKEAKRRKIDLANVVPSGTDDLILMRDLDTISDDPGDPREGDIFTLRGPRLAAAKRMELSSRTLATTALTFRCNAEGILATHKAHAKANADVTILSIVARCVVSVLAEHPKFNSTILEEERALKLDNKINLGIAVDAPSGLVVPVIQGANGLDVEELAVSIAELADKARGQSLSFDDVRDATFTLSSTGGLESAMIVGAAPVINYPNVATLWVSRITEQARVSNRELEVGSVMYCTLSFDHRFLHGGEAIAFINALDARFQAPESI